MNIEKYREIVAFFTNQSDITQFEKDCVMRKVFENYYKQIYFIDQNGNETRKTDAEIAAIESTLVSSENLLSYLDSANTFYVKWLNGKEAEIQKKNSKGSFFKSVWVGVVSNIAYSIFLIIIFVLAKSQITSWLQTLIE